MALELVWPIAGLSGIILGEWTHGSKYRMFVSFVFWFQDLSDLSHCLSYIHSILATAHKHVRWKKVFQELLLQTHLGESSASYSLWHISSTMSYHFWFDSDSRKPSLLSAAMERKLAVAVYYVSISTLFFSSNFCFSLLVAISWYITLSSILSSIQLLWMILATALLNVVWKQTALVDADKRSSHRVCSHYCVLDGGCEMQPFWCLEVLLEVLLFTPIIFIIHYIGDRCKYCSTESNQPNQKKDILDFILSQI